MSGAELDLRAKAELRGFRLVKLDRTGTRWILYRGGKVVCRGTVQKVGDRMDQALIDAVTGLSTECQQAMVEVSANAC